MDSLDAFEELQVRYRRFNRNVLVSVAVRGATLASGLISAAVLARGLGITVYGLWALATTFMSYLALIDLGVSGGLMRLTGEASRKQDRSTVANYTAIATSFYAILGLVVVALVLLLQGILATLLGVPISLRPEAGGLFVTAAALLMLNNLTAVYQATVGSIEAIHLTSIITLITAVGNLVAAVFLQAVLQLGAEAVLLGMLASALLTLVASMIIYRAICNPTHWFPRRLRWSELRSMANFTSGVQLSNIASIINSSLDKFILSAFVGLAATATYDLGARPSLLASSVSWLIATAAYPALVKVSPLRAESRTLFQNLEVYQQIAGCGLAGLLVALARPFVDLWIGPQYTAVVPVLQILAISRCGLVLTNLSTVAHWARGATQDTVIFAGARLALHITCSLLLVWKFGLMGALVSALISFTVPSAWFIRRTSKFLDLPVWPWVLGFAKVLLASAIATGLGLLTGIFIDVTPILLVVRWVLEFVAGGIVYFLAIVGMLVLLRVVNWKSIRRSVLMSGQARLGGRAK